MLRTLLLSFIILLSISPTTHAQEHSLDLPDFTKISASDAINVIVTQGPTQSVTVETRTDEFENILVHSERGTLFLGRRDVNASNKISISKGLESSGTVIRIDRKDDEATTVETSSYGTSGIAINGQSLSYLIDGVDSDTSNISIDRRGGRTFVKINDTPRPEVLVKITVPNLQAVFAQFGASVNMREFDLDALMVEGDYGGEVHLAGRCDHLNIKIDHSAMVHSRNFKCDTATVLASHGAKVHLHAREFLSATARYNARIKVFGAPERIEKFESDRGRVRRSWFR